MNDDIIKWSMFAALCTTSLGVVVIAYQRDELKAEAVKRNAAEWVVDPQTGKTTFTWKPLP